MPVQGLCIRLRVTGGKESHTNTVDRQSRTAFQELQFTKMPLLLKGNSLKNV